jgi:hypothetical protein
MLIGQHKSILESNLTENNILYLNFKNCQLCLTYDVKDSQCIVGYEISIQYRVFLVKHRVEAVKMIIVNKHSAHSSRSN